MTKDKVRGIAILKRAVKDALCVATVSMAALCFVVFVITI
jgi:hypothetical protein